MTGPRWKFYFPEGFANGPMDFILGSVSAAHLGLNEICSLSIVEGSTEPLTGISRPMSSSFDFSGLFYLLYR